MKELFEFIFEKQDLKFKSELQKTRLFQDFSSREMDVVLRKTGMRTFSKGQRVFFEGDAGSALYIIVKGAVQIVRHESGKVVPLAALSQGMFFGELALVEALPRSASALVTEDAVFVYLFRHDLEKLVHEHPRVGAKLLWNVAQVLGQRLRAMNERMR